MTGGGNLNKVLNLVKVLLLKIASFLIAMTGG